MTSATVPVHGVDPLQAADPTDRPDVAPWLGAALVLAALVLWEIPPGFAWYDSGELAAAALQLGVPHPTGFALFDLAGHTLARLPLGPAVMRVHMLGTLCAVAAVVLLWRSWPRLRGLPRGAEALAWVMPLVLPAVFLHVRATEVYPPTWLVAAATVTVWQSDRGARRVAQLGLLAGLGVGVHVEAALLPGLALLAAAFDVPAGQRLRALAWVVALGLGGALGIAYLPLAAARQPLFSWGDVRTAQALLDHLTGASIRAAFAGRMGGVSQGMVALAHVVWRDARLLLLPAGVGAWSLWQSRALWPTLALLVTDAAYSVVINPMGLRDDQAGLLVLLVLGLWAARGVGVAVLWRPRVFVLPAVVLWLAMVALGQTQHPPQDLADAQRLSDRLLRDVAPGAVALAASDHIASACILAQTAESSRPDAPCLSLQLLRDPRNARAVATTRQMPELATLANDADALVPPATRMGKLLRTWRGRHVYWEVGSRVEDSLVRGHLQPGFPWSQVVDVPEEMTLSTAAWQRDATRYCGGESESCGGRPTLAAWLATQASLHGVHLLEPGRAARSPAAEAAAADANNALLQFAVAIAPEHAGVLNSLAAQAIARHQYAEALALCDRALAALPDYARPHRTASRAAFASGQPELGLAHARAYVDAQPPEETRPWLELMAHDASPPWNDRLRALRK